MAILLRNRNIIIQFFCFFYRTRRKREEQTKQTNQTRRLFSRFDFLIYIFDF